MNKIPEWAVEGYYEGVWLLECYEHTLMEALDQVKAYKKEYPNMKYKVVNEGVCRQWQW